MSIVRIDALRQCRSTAHLSSLAFRIPRVAVAIAGGLLVAGCLGPTAKDETSYSDLAIEHGTIDVPSANSDRCPSFPPQLPHDLSRIAQTAEQHALPEKKTPLTDADESEMAQKALAEARKEIEKATKELEQLQEEGRVLKEIEKRLEGLENHRRWIEEWQRRWGRIELLPLWPSTAPPEVWIHDKRPDDTPPQWSPNIVGKVLKVTGDGEVEISLGSDNGLAPGHRVDIYRPVAGTLSYVGRVQATEVTHERAVGKILPEFGTSAICIGDGVATLRR